MLPQFLLSILATTLQPQPTTQVPSPLPNGWRTPPPYYFNEDGSFLYAAGLRHMNARLEPTAGAEGFARATREPSEQDRRKLLGILGMPMVQFHARCFVNKNGRLYWCKIDPVSSSMISRGPGLASTLDLLDKFQFSTKIAKSPLKVNYIFFNVSISDGPTRAPAYQAYCRDPMFCGLIPIPLAEPLSR